MSDQQTQPSRRLLLGGSAGVALGGLLTGFGAGRASATSAGQTVGVQVAQAEGYLPFYGVYQSGILQPPQAHAVFIGCDLPVDEAPGGQKPEEMRESVKGLLNMLGEDAQRLMSGQGVLADTEPEMAGPATDLSITVGVGPGLLELLGISSPMVQPLPTFAGDQISAEYGQTDVIVQCCAQDPTVLEHAVRALTKNLRGITTLVFTQRGFMHMPRAAGGQSGGTFRNLLGQVDGINNPVGQVREDAVFGDAQNPSWRAGGTTLVLRRIRMDLEAWDRVDRAGRDFALGRRQSDGSPLSGSTPQDPVDVNAVDELGLPVIASQSHVARAAPRDADEVMWRRGYNYLHGAEAGLLFASYQRDPRTSFIPVQQRLASVDALNEWVSAVGSAVYAILPGLSAGELFGEQLLAAEAN